MNAIALLKEDHREALELIEQLENIEGSLDAAEGGVEFAPTGLFNQLKRALTLHTQMEEQVFYPAMREFEETRDLIPEAIEAHQAVDQILEDLSILTTIEDDFQEKLEELKEILEHHMDEEEDEMFPKAEEVCGRKQLDEMGRQMQQIKQGRGKGAAGKL